MKFQPSSVEIKWDGKVLKGFDGEIEIATDPAFDESDQIMYRMCGHNALTGELYYEQVPDVELILKLDPKGRKKLDELIRLVEEQHEVDLANQSANSAEREQLIDPPGDEEVLPEDR